MVKKDFYDESGFSDDLLVTDFIYFIICDGDFYIEEDFEGLNQFYNFEDFIYGGEIHVEDYEVKAYKYNL